MLEELYQYAVTHELDVRPGFKRKRPKAYFHLSASGQFLDLELTGREMPAVLAPDVGAAANGTKLCNPLIEKAGISLCMAEDEKKDKNVPVKHEFFLLFLEKGKEAEPLFEAAEKALRSPDTRKRMQEALFTKKLKPSDPVGFAVDGQYLEKSRRYWDWWKGFRRDLKPSPKGTSARCLITGNLVQPMATVPKVSGLSRVGGHTSGDAFLCFDKDAFQSYGLKQSANAAVSEEAMAAVNAALERLIQDASILGGTKMVHWYTGQVSGQEDLIDIFQTGSLLAGEDTEEDEGEELGEVSEEKLEKQEEEKDALRAARKLLQSIQEGRFPGKPEFRYYLMPVSGAGGRMMVRGWYEGTYESLYHHVRMWFEDLRLILPGGFGKTRPPKLEVLCLRLLKPGGGSKSLWERLDQELKNLVHRIVYAVVEGAPLPDEAAYRALQWLRSYLLTEEKKRGEQGENRKQECHTGETKAGDTCVSGIKSLAEKETEKRRGKRSDVRRT
jgi:CRISPR-associated protein Csd1